MTEQKSTNITRHEGEVTIADRAAAYGHKPAVLWFTGLSGSGKSTVAHAVEKTLFDRGCHVYVLDGDNIRHGLNRNLGFSDEDRSENIRRISEVAKLFHDAGVIVMTAFISPFRADRAAAREIVGGGFVEIHVDADLDTCESRDPKGLYKKARTGEIPEFTGISSPYEAPENPEIVVNTSEESLEQSAGKVIAWLESQGLIES